MKTIALRFSDRFAPPNGTIKAHQYIIHEKGCVWFGKLGLPVSDKAIDYICSNESPRILLIHSGRTERYWAYVNAIQKECPPIDLIPAYYRDDVSKFHTWFQVSSFENAEKNILSQFIVLSSGQPLSAVSRSSMSPYFIIGSGGV